MLHDSRSMCPRPRSEVPGIFVAYPVLRATDSDLAGRTDWIKNVNSYVADIRSPMPSPFMQVMVVKRAMAASLKLVEYPTRRRSNRKGLGCALSQILMAGMLSIVCGRLTQTTALSFADTPNGRSTWRLCQWSRAAHLLLSG